MGFRSYEQQRVSQVVVPLVLNQLTHKQHGSPVLLVCHLGETNAEFWNDAIAKANTEKRSVGPGKREVLTPIAVAQARQKNRDTVVKYAVKGLENVWHDDSIDPETSMLTPGLPATGKDIPAVIEALPDDVFDSVLAFVTNPNNFRSHDIAGDPQEIAKK